ncbi:response regulator [Ramlibacter albus]|uniref:Response regulator n=1 Tax=Ramlibacter albus TaxID=2079448 RepID=A0A923MEJ0_9BURK|nr:response regulator [Ramlibacter albus]MBC5768043.1 response regulator [Ramlibacter albus]
MSPTTTPTLDTAAVVRLAVKGFSAIEHKLLEGTVKLSQRRAPRIDLLAEADAHAADVVLIDAQDSAAVQWAAAQPWLPQRAAIWAGAKTTRPQHMAAERQIKWPILPVLLYRALELAPREQPAAAPAASVASRRVLVVDDSLAVRNYLRSMLEKEGIEVHEAESAEQGIETAAAGNYACVLMDVLLPGIDGFEACRRLKARARNGHQLPVVMLTSKSSPFDRVRGKMAGCDTYLTKPVDPNELRGVVARHVAPH